MDQRIIKLRLSSSILLLLTSKFPCFKKCGGKDSETYIKIYKQGQKRITDQMNIIRIVKDLMNFRIMFRNQACEKIVKEITRITSSFGLLPPHCDRQDALSCNETPRYQWIHIQRILNSRYYYHIISQQYISAKLIIVIP